MTSTSTNKVAHNIKEAFEQVSADNYRYSSDTHRDGRVDILSKSESFPPMLFQADTIESDFENLIVKAWKCPEYG